ncbi:AraC family transcriptional regulator [Nocardioides sp. GXZ039]|uniref:AraC family transcriptional regulator n=1 Tax=Nocardioides sp. GXZ039 TaxID=3136018 RepID=UPI0030F4A4FD
MPGVLERHRLIATTDLDAARAEVADRFCSHRLGLTERHGRLDMVHNAAALSEGLSLNYLRYGAEVRITPGTLDRFYLLQIPLSGSARVRVGDRVVASNRHIATLPSPDEPVDMIWSDDCEMLLVYLRREVVEAHHDGRPVHFDPHVDLDQPALRSWSRLLQYTADELERDSGLLGSAVTSATRPHLEQALITGLLEAQPNSTRVAPADERPVVSMAVRRAVDLVHDDPAREWRVADLAAECGVSVRSLQEGFRRERGVTPLGEIRDARLARARADLLAGTPDSTSVTEVAARWGFFHLGRFAQVYRERHGETPSQTLSA